VGWAPIAGEDFSTHLDHLRSPRKLKGLRHIIQSEPDDNFILNASFNRGIARLKNTGLVYDILIFDRHLPAATQFVDRHPQQRFVLDHVAKPRIRERVLDPWRRNIAELAKRENVYCKISGIVTEADWGAWSQHDLWPYLEVALEAFGPRRLMVGLRLAGVFAGSFLFCLVPGVERISGETGCCSERADFGRHRKRSLRPVAAR
jgi:L-fucono-1,5-lactonase